MHNHQRYEYIDRYGYLRGMYRASYHNFREICDHLYMTADRTIRYSEEPEAAQSVKTLEAIRRDRVGDCKHYSAIICGVANAMNLPACYRFADYGDGVQHVYAVLCYGDKLIAIDPVSRRGTGYERPTVKHYDFWVRP